MQTIKRIPFFSDLVDVFIPRICVGCSEIITTSRYLCTNCSNDLELLRLPPEAELINGLPVMAPYDYSFPVSSLVTAAKFRNLPNFFLPLARAMCEVMAESELYGYPQVVVPVPLHPARRRERGFDQAQYLAAEVAGFLDIPHLPKALKRIRFTLPQKRAGKQYRLEALQDAFGSGRQADRIEGNRVLLVDDVVTTGATLEAAYQALLMHQPAGVLSLVAARTPPHAESFSEDEIEVKGNLDLPILQS